MDLTALLKQLTAAVLFGFVGIAMFFLALSVLRRMLPFSIDKELAEDQNVAVAVVMGSMLIGLAIILSSAISG